MAGLHKFKIVAPLNQRAAYIEIDGKRLEGVTGIAFKAVADNKPMTLLIEVIGQVEVEGEFQPCDIITVARLAKSE
jgi:hypothetical protein